MCASPTTANPSAARARNRYSCRSYTTKKEGSGIGLSISRQIMTQHNGTIDLLASNTTETVFEMLFR